MCTVVVRWAPDRPTQILALRDELTTREFDDPDFWWPASADVIGGRDRTAGGTWCAHRVSTGVTALVLNRPQRRFAAPGAPSRGVLPLLGVTHESSWTSYVDLDGMASFALVLATPQQTAQAEALAARLGDLCVGTFTQATMHTPVAVTDQAVKPRQVVGGLRPRCRANRLL